MTVNIRVGAQLETAGVEARLSELTRKINSTGASIAKAGGIKFEPIKKATVDQLERIERSMANIAKLAPQVAARIKASGQAGASLFDLDWSRIYSDPAAGNRAARGVFSLATGLGFSEPPGPPPPRTPGFAPPAPTPASRPGSPSVPRWVQSGLNAAGPVGNVASRSLSAGLRGGFVTGAAGFAGGLAALGVGALISGVRQYVGAAQQESIATDALRNQLGGTASGISFNGLRSRIRSASDQAFLSYDEAQGYARLLARRGGINDPRELAEQLAGSAGFARSFGFDAGAGVAAFGGLRGAGVTRNADDARRLGLAIAEGIARAGVFSKAEDFLQEIASYGEQQTRSNLDRANVEGFLSGLTGLLNLRQPGLDPHGAGALLGRANSAIMRGGAAGEAGQAFLFQAAGRRLGLSPIDTMILQEGGIFATGRNTFGPGTSMGGFFDANGLRAGRAAGSDVTMLQMVLEGLEERYPDPRLRLNATANIFSLSMRQARALVDLRPDERSGIAGLGLTDEQIRTLNPTGIATMGRIGVGNRGELNNLAREFQTRTGAGALTEDERRRLDQAQRGGSDQQLREVLAEIAAGRQQEETQGLRTLRTLQDIEKGLTDAASRLLDPLNTARDALLVLAGGGRAGRAFTAAEVRNRVRDAEIGEIDESQRNALAANEAARNALSRRERDASALLGNPMTPEERQRELEAIAAERHRLDQEDERIRREHKARRDDVQDRSAAEAAADEAARRQRERLRRSDEPSDESGTRTPLGERNNNPLNIIDGRFTRGQQGYAGRGEGGFARFESMEQGVAAADALLRSYARDGLTTPLQIASRWAPRGHGNNDPDAYAANVGRRLGIGANDRLDMADPAVRRRLIDAMAVQENGRRIPQEIPLPPIPPPGEAPMPADAPADAVRGAAQPRQGDSRVQGSVEGIFRLEDQRGNPLAAPIRVQTGWRPARPSGALA